jgi:AraC-like DNA-binding protein
MLPPEKIPPPPPPPDRVTGEGIVPEIRRLAFRECTPDWRIKKDVFPHWNITYLVEGSARYIIDGKEYDLNAGDLLCLPPGHIRVARTWPDRLMKCFAVSFKLINLNGASARLPFRLVEHIGLREDLIYLFHELVFTWMDRQSGYIIKTRALFMLVLHRLFELLIYKVDSSIGDSRVRKVLHYISDHYAKKITVKKMADLAGLNTVYFGAVFKQETGMTLNKYLIRTRIMNAKTMLLSGKYKVSEAAVKNGYNDINHFCKHFKEICGFSPSAYIPKKNK